MITQVVLPMAMPTVAGVLKASVSSSLSSLPFSTVSVVVSPVLLAVIVALGVGSGKPELTYLVVRVVWIVPLVSEAAIDREDPVVASLRVILGSVVDVLTSWGIALPVLSKL